MIPKTIHYCWFGNGALGEKELKCIESWKKYCPDYEIIRWDESNFDYKGNTYSNQAYNQKKWAFVSDYARFKILYEQGGLYFDTDVEMIKPIDDIVSRGAFFGLERKSNAPGNVAIAPGLGMGAEKGNDIYKEVLEYFNKARFLNDNGEENIKTIVDTVTNVFYDHGFQASSNIQELCGIYLYPEDYFAPMDYRTGKILITDNTRSIHHYAGSWLEPDKKRIQERQYKIIKKYGESIGMPLSKIYGIFARFYLSIKDRGLIGSFRYYINIVKKSWGKLIK